MSTRSASADEQASGILGVILAGGLYCFMTVPACLTVFTGEKIAADPRGFTLPIVTEGEAFVYLGWSIAAAVLLPLSDRIGRKPVLYGLYPAGFLGVLCSLRTEHAVVYQASQFVVGGLCLGGLLGVMLSVESAPPKWQGNVMVGINVMWYTTLAILALICGQGTRDLPWRAETALAYAPGVALILMVALLVKEPLPREPVSADSGESQRERGIQLLFSRKYRSTTACTCCTWMACCLAYFGLTFSAGSLSDDKYTNVVLLSIVDVFSTAAGGLLMEWSEPVALQAACFALVFPLMLGLSALPPGTGLVAGALFGRFCIDVAFVACYRLNVEHFPPECRASALGLCNFASRFVSAATPTCMLLPAWAACCFFSGVCLLASFASSSLPRVVPKPPGLISATGEGLL